MPVSTAASTRLHGTRRPDPHRPIRVRPGRPSGPDGGRVRAAPGRREARRRSSQDLLRAPGRPGRFRRRRIHRPPGPFQRGDDLEPGLLGRRLGPMARRRNADRDDDGHRPPPTDPPRRPQRTQEITPADLPTLAGAVVMNSWSPDIAVHQINSVPVPEAPRFLQLLHQAYEAEPLTAP